MDSKTSDTLERDPSLQRHPLSAQVSNKLERVTSPHLEIQIRIDKEHGAFKSVADSENNEVRARKEFAFGEVDGRFIDYKVGH